MKKLNEIFGISICLNSRTTITVLISLLLSGIVIANVVVIEKPIKDIIKKTDTEVWIPTAEDIAYQDSMYTIIQTTQSDITEIKQDIVYILERLDYEDGTWDSIRYVKGGKIDNARNK
tara:strand:- start:6821 stop:7174 length:354 start_codon:yes stop_codon:yes gene_type:complete